MAMRWDQVLRRDSAVTGSLIAVGHDNVHDLAALPDAGLAAADAQPLRAHCLAATATTLRRIIGAGPPPAWRADLERRLGAASRGLSRDTIEEVSARGCSMTLPEAIAFAQEETSPPHA
jgi:hypothetical protein